MAPGSQVPAPSQVPALVWVPALHDGAAQVVPAGYSSQAPIPLQRPFVPQVDAGVMAQSLFGSVPAGTAAHAPSGWPVSAAMQAVQTPEHAVLQHTPSAQKPLPHWEAVEQAVPLPWSVVVVVVLVVVVVVATISGAHTS